MGTRARREQEKENMRNAILEAATKIIVSEGYEKLSMRKIAEAIDYTPTTIYIYYKDKAQIVDDISREVYRKIVLNIKKVLDGNKDIPADKQLELSFKEFVETMTSNSEMGKAIIRSGTRAIFGPAENSDTPEEQGTAILQALLLKGLLQSKLRKLDDNIPWMLISALIGFAANAIENQLYLSTNWHEIVNVYVEMLMNGLLPREEHNNGEFNLEK